MINFSKLSGHLQQTNLKNYEDKIFQNIQIALDETKHGDLKHWNTLLDKLPSFEPSKINIQSSTIQIGTSKDISINDKNELEKLLRQFHPWRKGPYSIFDIFIDTEWRSDLKWDRLKDHIQSLKDRIVLDVGCGNGYHCWRVAGTGAKLVLGIEPYLLSVKQFEVINHFIKENVVYVLPLGIEDFPINTGAFDTVFSMGVLYHRKSPIDHLLELRNQLRSGGELILETLVIDGPTGQVLVPENRYAKMRNVWFLPSCLTLESWLKRCAFKNIRLIDVTKTTTKEQRSTDWMQFESLESHLDPNDNNKTIEGLPAPKRAIFLAESL